MSSAMDVDTVPEGSQPDTQSPGEPFLPETPDPAEFNPKVLRAIEECRTENPLAFAQTRLVVNDPSLLLRIIVESYLGCDMDDQACGNYLYEHLEFTQSLEDAYASHSFVDLLDDLQLPPEVIESARTSARGVRNYSDDPAFEEPYLGNTAKLFIDTLNRERRSYPPEAAGRPYNWSISVIQSSGMGKSRMVEEAANTVFTIPINLREDLPPGKKTHPPPDVEIRQYFEARKDKSNEEQQAEYAILLRVLFDKSSELVERCWPDLTGEALAKACADYFKEGRTEGKVGTNRHQFFSAVVSEAAKRRRGPDKGRSLDSLGRSLRKSGKKLVDVVRPNRRAGTNAYFVHFDEAQALVQPVQPPCEMIPLHNLGTALSKLDSADIFFIFSSKDSRVKGFAPPPHCHPSDLVFVGSQVVPPFNELPFDLHEDRVLDSIGSLTLENVCKTKAMVGFGRTLWFAQYKTYPTGDIFCFAVDKLCASGADDRKEDTTLAALGIRIGITFDRTHPASHSIQSRLVESHMRVVYSIPRHQEYMHSGSPSEPILAEAAGRYLNSSSHGGIAKMGPEVLASACEKGFLARGERGELCGRLLVTVAHDIALRRYLAEPDTDGPYYHRPIPVLDFLRALFHSAHHDRILGAKPITAMEESGALSQTFSESFVFFSHFSIAEDSEMLSTFGLATALVRGMAIQAEGSQCSIDAVIPVHMGSPTTPISLETTSAINLQFRNRKKALDCHVNRLITVPDITKPVISIIFELGDEGQESGTVKVVQKSHSTTRLEEQQGHRDDRHYLITAHGCSPTVFGAILPKTEVQYNAILGAASFMEDFPRKGVAENADALLNMKPAFSGDRQKELYAKRIK